MKEMASGMESPVAVAAAAHLAWWRDYLLMRGIVDHSICVFLVEPIFHSFHSFHSFRVGLKRQVFGAYGGVVRSYVDSLTINLDL